ncbi:TlpA family protein disulfide reductase [Acidicapsa ligni]|uniref:TlpA family protein disulfide reductase n=1 Tax=Acidicapsa ligni TaxID=542300 RepID=UPI0021E03F38|nr:TlpA disulfide reductase family protein [Acidicapsa ligni]
MAYQPSAPYYKYVRTFRLSSLLCGLLLVAITGCDRGNHPSQTGRPAPDFNISDGATHIHLADYKGKVVLVNFWASWCVPCILELPSLLELQRQHPEIAVLAISIDEDEDAYKRFLVNHHVDLLTVRDPQETVATKYHTEMWPETFVIDRQGKIRRRFIGAEDWSTPEIRSYLSSL